MLVKDEDDGNGGQPFQECAAHLPLRGDEGLGAQQRTFSPQVLRHSRRQRLCRFTATYQ